MHTYLVTGGAGFIGSNFIQHILDVEPDATVVNLDALTYAAVPETVDALRNLDRHRLVEGDIRDADIVAEAMEGVDVVVHFAAESHVDRSISAPLDFIETNVVGTGVLLTAARMCGVERFIYVSTDEVYGSVSEGFAVESSPIDPSSPYSASKAAGDMLARSFATTYGMDVVVTRCTNNYGAFQFPEKLIPLSITRLLDGGAIPLYGDGLHERDWLHVSDHCRALSLVIERGDSGGVYNIGSGDLRSNLEVARTLVESLGLDETAIEHVRDRPGHDRRYAVDADRIRRLGWEPAASFESRITETVAWYRDHETWWRAAQRRIG